MPPGRTANMPHEIATETPDVPHEHVPQGSILSTSEGKQPVTVRMTLDELRRIVVRGCIAATEKKLRDRQQCAAEVQAAAMGHGG